MPPKIGNVKRKIKKRNHKHTEHDLWQRKANRGFLYKIEIQGDSNSRKNQQLVDLDDPQKDHGRHCLPTRNVITTQ